MNKIAVGMLFLAILLIGLVVWRWPGRDAGYDFETAFESLPELPEPAPIDLRGFAGQPRDAAEAVLGRPQRCEAALHSARCAYTGGIEVVYIDGRADWITISLGYGRYPLAPETLQRLGLPEVEPQTREAHRLLWRDLAGLRELQLVGDDNGAMYVRIKVIHG